MRSTKGVRTKEREEGQEGAKKRRERRRRREREKRDEKEAQRLGERREMTLSPYLLCVCALLSPLYEDGFLFLPEYYEKAKK